MSHEINPCEINTWYSGLNQNNLKAIFSANKFTQFQTFYFDFEFALFCFSVQIPWMPATHTYSNSKFPIQKSTENTEKTIWSKFAGIQNINTYFFALAWMSSMKICKSVFTYGPRYYFWFFFLNLFQFSQSTQRFFIHFFLIFWLHIATHHWNSLATFFIFCSVFAAFSWKCIWKLIFFWNCFCSRPRRTSNFSFHFTDQTKF